MVGEEIPDYTPSPHESHSPRPFHTKLPFIHLNSFETKILLLQLPRKRYKRVQTQERCPRGSELERKRVDGGTGWISFEGL